MIKTVTEQAVVCDVCETNHAFSHRGCRSCGKLFCYDCEKTHAVEYKSGVYFQGSQNGTYCLACNARLMAKPDALFTAYRNIKALRDEQEAYYSEFDLRRKAAEVVLEKLLLK